MTNRDLRLAAATLVVIGLVGLVAASAAAAGPSVACLSEACTPPSPIGDAGDRQAYAKANGCCKPPPCSYYQQLAGKMAIQKAYLDPDSRMAADAHVAQFMKDPEHGNLLRPAETAIDQFSIFIDEKAEGAKNAVAPPGCTPDNLKLGPPFETTETCTVVDKNTSNNLSLDRALETHPGTCREFIVASMAHEGEHVAACNKSGAKRRYAEKLSRVNEEAQGYQTEIAYLESEMRSHLLACTAFLTPADRALEEQTLDRAATQLAEYPKKQGK